MGPTEGRMGAVHPNGGRQGWADPVEVTGYFQGEQADGMLTDGGLSGVFWC